MGLIKNYFNALTNYPTTAPFCTMDFRVDAGAQAAGTATLVTIPLGATVIGFRATVTEAVDSATDNATVQFGLSSLGMLSLAVAEATLVEGYVFGSHAAGIATNSIMSAPHTLTVSDTFDCIVGTATLTAGKFDVTIFYHPSRDGAMDSSYKEFVTA